jgi:hypothetical protein
VSRPLSFPGRRPRRSLRRSLHQALEDLVVAVGQVAVRLAQEGAVGVAPRASPRQRPLHALHVGDVAAEELAQLGVGAVLLGPEFADLRTQKNNTRSNLRR